ncbi:MAG TPA: helix-turn-helix transcriptional regulator [Streptosporangiaceae bacterium]|nr:helix-turn-helix transcriptional regulator [Streptosporangiaceae bacterium]HVB45019.1 helix-turn-helix transcriptional regulator [Streptosporangiaceae bacterium]
MVADTTVRPGIRGLFDGLVPSAVIEAYDRLLATDGCAKDQAETTVGDAGLVAELTRRGMAHIQPHSPADPAWLRPASPDLALQGVLAGHQSQLARGQELLLDGHRRLAGAQARFSTTASGRFPAHLVSVVSDRAEISELSASLMNTARQDWMTLENLHTEMPLTDDFARPPLPAFGSRVRCRSIYDAAAMENPVARRIIQACADAGEQARLLGRVPMKMKLADRATAMLPLTPAGTAGALIIKAPVIIAALREYFELLWDRATPLTAPQPQSGTGPLTPAQQRVLELMAEGLQDGAIASRAGISITTVRRHITVIMTRLGVSSRFAAGAAAQRRGWIG